MSAARRPRAATTLSQDALSTPETTAGPSGVARGVPGANGEVVPELAFTVPGEPVPKGRARSRIVASKGRAIAVHYTPAATKAYESYVALLCRVAVAARRWTWAPKDRFGLRVAVYRTHEGAGGDLDNYVKAVADAVNGIAFADDRYVREVSAALRQDPASPRVEVTVWRITGGTAR